MVEIRHLSVIAKNPETAAKALAAMTNGNAEEFISRNMPGAWVCVWNKSNNPFYHITGEREKFNYDR